MARGDKFIELTKFFENSNKDRLTLTFKEIEKILGFELAYSAYTYPAQWSNDGSQSFAYGWLNAGYKAKNVNLAAQTVDFFREGVETNVEPNNVKSSSKQNLSGLCNLKVEDAVEKVKRYYEDIVKDPHGRYKSWCHCYNAFVEKRSGADENTIDYLSLHLAFYLASWGMYRGSSFLLQKDYKVHYNIVKMLIEPKYDVLVGIKAQELLKEENLDLLMEISQRIRKAYAEEIPSTEGVVNNATDTLVTKILLGALGCVPAYDRYYVRAVKEYGISAGVYNKDSVRGIAQYYIDNEETFEKCKKVMSTGEREYSEMKIMDMCMWQAGVDLEEMEI